MTGYLSSFEPAMREAIAAAMSSGADVPVGAVVLDPTGVIIGHGHNQREALADPTAHAEVVALRAASAGRPRWRMDDVTAYVTLEPCAMCAGAFVNARVGRVVIGALDEKAGAVGSRYNLLSDPRLLHEASLTYDVLGEESAALLREFFVARRDDVDLEDASPSRRRDGVSDGGIAP